MPELPDADQEYRFETEIKGPPGGGSQPPSNEFLDPAVIAAHKEPERFMIDMGPLPAARMYELGEKPPDPHNRPIKGEIKDLKIFQTHQKNLKRRK